DRRKATSASPCLSSCHPAISVNETGTIATRGSFGPPKLAHAVSRPATARHAAPPPGSTLQRIVGKPLPYPSLSVFISSQLGSLDLMSRRNVQRSTTFALRWDCRR